MTRRTGAGKTASWSARAGRTPIFIHKATDAKNGFACGSMLRLREECPGTFRKMYAPRNIESAYAAIKLFGEALWPVKEHTQKTGLLAKVICHNMVA